MKTKIAIAKLAVGFALLPASVAATAQQVAPTTSDSVSTVYFIKDINSENLLKIYNALDRRATGKICVKLSFGEEGNPNHLAPELIAPLVKGLNATLVECNTAYKSSRRQSSDHLKTAKEHGFTAIAPIDIMDEAGETALPVKNGKHIDYALIGKNWLDYDYTIVLSHFKGHPMGGFGGALKNISIGLASSHGKGYIHGAGNIKKMWKSDHDSFLESMADASKSIMEYMPKIAFVNVMKNMSVDCDCCAVAEDPCMADIGILASLDPIAIDQACLDLVYASDDPGRDHLLERIESKNGVHTIEAAADLGYGSRDYELITIE